MIAHVQPLYVIAGDDLAPGTIAIEYVRPAEYGVQLVTDITISFTTQHTMYTPGSIAIEFPASIALPTTGSPVQIKPQGDTRNHFLTATGTVQTGNIIKIDNVFGGSDPPEGPLNFVLTF